MSMPFSRTLLRCILRAPRSVSRATPSARPSSTYVLQKYHAKSTYPILYHLNRHYATNRCAFDYDTHMKGQPPESSETPIQTESELPRRERHGISCEICAYEHADMVLQRAMDCLECVESCMRGAKDVLARMQLVVEHAENRERVSDDTITYVKNVLDHTEALIAHTQNTGSCLKTEAEFIERALTEVADL